MTLHFPTPTPLAYFETLVQSDTDFPLLEAAISLGQDEEPTLDVQGVLAKVDMLALRLKRRIPADALGLQKLFALNRFFFEEMGFGVNANDFHDPDNSDISVVLHTRRGIPISLAVVWLELAQQLDLNAVGVNFPGHFMVKVMLPQGQVVIDPLTGQSLDLEGLADRLGMVRRRVLEDDSVPWALFLQAAAPRDVVARMLRNLKEIHATQEDWPRLLQVLERLVRLLPQDWENYRDRGLVHTELGNREAAMADLTLYLDNAEGAPDHAALSERLEALRGGEA